MDTPLYWIPLILLCMPVALSAVRIAPQTHAQTLSTVCSSKLCLVIEKHTFVIEKHTFVIEKHTFVIEKHTFVIEKHTFVIEKHTFVIEKTYICN
jgi:hypothetical protein